MKILVNAIADTHVNSITGLIAPSTTVDDPDSYIHIQRTRLWLWSSWLDYCEFIRQKARKEHAKIATIMVGDLGDKDYKTRGYNNYTRNPETIKRMMAEALAPAVDISEWVYVVRGTPSHTGKSGVLEEGYAQDIGAVRPNESQFSWWHLQAYFSEVLFDCSHFGRMGSKPHTRPNPLNDLASRVMHNYRRPPDVVLRAHKHHKGDSGYNYPCLVVALPSWQIDPDYIHHMNDADGELPEIGGAWFLCDQGKYTWGYKVYTPLRMEPQHIG